MKEKCITRSLVLGLFDQSYPILLQTLSAKQLMEELKYLKSLREV